MSGRNDVKERILRAAADLFMARGFAGTTVREIGEHAGVGQSSLYHHARSKGQLLAELHANFSGDLIGLLEEVVASQTSPTIQLRGVVATIMAVVHDHRAVATVYLRESYALSDERRAELGPERTKVNAIVDLILERGRSSGEFRSDLDIPLTRLAILGMCNWAYQWYRPDGRQTITEISECFADLAEAAVLGGRPKKAGGGRRKSPSASVAD
ncbi:MAG: TetR/AcrR family transcriptional regulator [Caulobacter sp.]|nr:TetR/AcrR family transcriptional regulator [Caulobacter sp.]